MSRAIDPRTIALALWDYWEERLADWDLEGATANEEALQAAAVFFARYEWKLRDD